MVYFIIWLILFFTIFFIIENIKLIFLLYVFENVLIGTYLKKFLKKYFNIFLIKKYF
jgi:hypothetical protein